MSLVLRRSRLSLALRVAFPAVCPYCGGAHTLSQCPRWRC